MYLRDEQIEQELQEELVTPWGEDPNNKAPLKVAYIMSRFPKLTETFILYEILAMQKEGVQVEVYPLLREKTEVIHPEAIPLVENANFSPFISLKILKANLHFLRKRPGMYFKTLWTVLSRTLGSFRFFIGVLGIFPKSVLFAYQMETKHIAHVHAHFASHPAAAAFIINRLTGIPYSFTAHGSDLHRDRHMLREKVADSKFVVAISEYNRNLILSECQGNYKDKVKVLHCGVDTDVFQFRSGETPFEKGEKPFMILCIGTLHEVKGQTFLIEACRNLSERGIDFTCHFVGDGPDRTALTELASQAGLSSKVFFHGRQKQERVARLLQDTDVLVAPSVPTRDGRREGIPMVLMEAMSSGVPVIASAISGIPELVIDGRTGLLASPGDSLALATALEHYYREPSLRKRLGSAGREMVQGEFNLYRNAGRLAQFMGSEEVT